MEQVIIQYCGCIALPKSVATALNLKRGMTLDVALNGAGDSILLTPHRDDRKSAETAGQSTPFAGCVILPPSR